MRLINTTTLELKEFHGPKIPPYAILSHVWSPGQEVTYEEYITSSAQERSGYRKVFELCRLCREGFDLRHLQSLVVTESNRSIFAHTQQLLTDDWLQAFEGVQTAIHWAWIDTCCIDQSSSSELSEAIKSMFKWYKNAAVCLVFMPDVDGSNSITQGYAPFHEAHFLSSRWFTRGWTLQELIAPSSIVFYNSDFSPIGNANKTVIHSPEEWIATSGSLHNLIHRATGIDKDVLHDALHDIVNDICIAKRMSWASKRETTKPEDIAYCLIGIFRVNLTLEYGEGAVVAFSRLQRALISRTTDECIYLGFPSTSGVRYGLLSRNPSDFQQCQNVKKCTLETLFSSRATFAMGPRGGEMSLEVPHGIRQKWSSGYWLMYPLAHTMEHGSTCYMVICVEKSNSKYADNADRARKMDVRAFTSESHLLAFERALRGLSPETYATIDTSIPSTLKSTFRQRLTKILMRIVNSILAPARVKLYFSTEERVWKSWRGNITEGFSRSQMGDIIYGEPVQLLTIP